MLSPDTILQNQYRVLRTLSPQGDVHRTHAVPGRRHLSTTYLAEHTLSGRYCVIKESRPDPQAAPQALTRARQQFRAEARTLARLDHPNLPKVSDYFEEGGREYLVMDYVEGEDLHRVLRRHGRPLSEESVLPWIQQVLDALDYLHNRPPRPFIHRDIKPANIILTPQGQVKLVGFGLIELLDPDDPQKAITPRELGTPGYIPLEQYENRTGYPDERADLYALGATLYCLLTGVLPPDPRLRFLDPTVMRAPREINPAITRQTEAAIQRALELHPDRRYQTAVEMQADLRVAPPVIYYAPASAPPQPAQASSWSTTISIFLTGVVLLFCLFLCLTNANVRLFGQAPTPTQAARRIRTPTPTVTRTPIPPLAVTPTNMPTSMSLPTTITRPQDGKAMVLVPAGTFLMGSADTDSNAYSREKPQHWVYLDAYYIDETEITNAEFCRFLNVEGNQEEGGVTWLDIDSDDCLIERRTGQFEPRPGYAEHPVVGVSWYGARAYAQWVGGYLPTEAQWEKAARGTDGRIYPWGAEWEGSRCNSGEGLSSRTAAVGSYPTGVSPYGVLDMAGNVWEWCADWFATDYYEKAPVSDPVGPGSGVAKVLRGGSFGYTRRFFRCAYRYYAWPDYRHRNLGFRVALPAERWWAGAVTLH